MNSIFFLIPFLALVSFGLIQDSYVPESFAAVEQDVVGINYFDVVNPDGSHTWSSHYEYVLDDGIYVPYVQNGLNVNSVIGNVTLNQDGSYTWNNKFDDKIVGKYADISDLTTWTYPKSINNAVPILSFVNDEFHSNKFKAGVGGMDYKYVFKNGMWKTELVVTNLSGLTTKVFGFDQTIDLHSDTIKIDDVIYNIDDFDGVVLSKLFLDNNKGKVLDLMNGVNFDFDLGYENLYSVTIHDTGVNSSQLVLDYRTSEILLPGETLLIDPTFGFTTNDNTRSITTTAQATTCSTTASAANITYLFLDMARAVDVDQCGYGSAQWDISALPNSITVSSIKVGITPTSLIGGGNTCEITPMTEDITTATYQDILDDIKDGTAYATAQTVCQGTSRVEVSLNAAAHTDFANDVSGDDLFTIGIQFDDYTRGGARLATTENPSAVDLEVVYTEVTPPNAVDDLTYTNLGAYGLDLEWTEPELNGGNLTNYKVLMDTPWTTPTSFFANSTNIFYNATGLGWGTPFSFSVSALTEGGYNFTGNVLNITTTSPLITGVAPTGLTVNDCYHTCSTQLNLEWTATLMDNINGFRIFVESPVGNGFTTDSANTTNSNTYYNATSLTAGQFYNFKVAAMNETGISENSTAYVQSPHKLPYSVTDLTITPNALLQFDGAWTAPTLYGTLTGYQINYTTPAGDPVTIYTSTNPGVTAVISGLNPTVEYSFRVAANTYHGINATFGNIANATASSEIAVGDLTFDAGINPDVEPIWYENYVVDTTTNDIQVRYDAGLTVDCTVTERISGNVNTFTGLSETAETGYVYHNFTVTNAGNDILDWDCYDQADSLVNGQYSLTQSESSSGVGGFANVPLFSQMSNFTDGLYGTEGNFAGIDLITLFIVIISMLGFNRQNPALGVGVMAVMLGAAWYFELIPWTSGVLGGIAVVVVLAIGQGTKKD
jgi:hypothetical protein